MSADLADPATSNPMTKLSPRQKQCLRLAFERKTSKEIAAELALGVGTVNTYITEAISVLNARNRRHAAELLHMYEVASRAPEKVQLQSEGVPEGPHHPPGGEGSDGWRRLLPVRQKGAIGNDLGIFARLSWPILGGFIIATGFGMLAVGMRVLSDIFRFLLQ